jgi:hypothetical protein
MILEPKLHRDSLDHGGSSATVRGAMALHPAVATLSGGVSCWTPGSSISISELLQEADGALFEAKSAVRNRVHMAPTHHDDECEHATLGPVSPLRL